MFFEDPRHALRDGTGLRYTPSHPFNLLRFKASQKYYYFSDFKANCRFLFPACNERAHKGDNHNSITDYFISLITAQVLAPGCPAAYEIPVG